MLSREHENRTVDSEFAALLEVLPGWYLADQGVNWPGWYYDDTDFTSENVTITANIAKAMHFNFNNRQDRFFTFAKKVSANFPNSKFVGINIDLMADRIFSLDQE
jgi:hypothetical protein